ncbi:MAG: DUF922 domain-containing Zn-dependent protease [Pseudoalteromonas sp.]
MKRLFILLAVYSSFLVAEPKVAQSHEFYNVSVSHTRNLLKNVNQASPIKHNGNKFHGYTEYNIQWRFNSKSRGRQRCILNKVKTVLTLKYTMPKLRSENEDVHKVWNSWYPNLEKHENGHGSLAVEAAKEIDSSLRAFSSRSGCQKINQEANELAYKIMEKLDQATKKYDLDTNHGETQGAWLYSHL